MMQSSLGRQTSSKNHTGQKWRFGTADRWLLSNKHSTHIYSTSIEHKPPSNYPGPGMYPAPSSIGSQNLSSRQSSSNFKFGTGTRDQLEKVLSEVKEHEKEQRGRNSPGPCTYENKSGVGKQDHAKKPSAAQWRFGQQDRFRPKANPYSYDYLVRGSQLPGVGRYEPAMAFGKQLLSARMTAPAFGFGTATRDNRAAAYIGRSHEKQFLGKGGPGPALYNPKDSADFVPTRPDTKDIAPRCRCGMEVRFTMNFTGHELTKDKILTPGPGAYN